MTAANFTNDTSDDERDMNTHLELGLDTFGDVTRTADGRAVSHAQVIRDVIAEAVLADRLGIDFIGVGEHHREDFAVSAPEVLLAAIEKGGTDRAAVSSALFETDVTDGIIGSFQIDENGDTTLGLVSVYQVKNGEETYVKSVTPELDFVEG